MSVQTFAKQLRASQTPAEELLWRHLRAHRFAGFKFKRQQPMATYILDFVCFAEKVVIEMDGGQHNESDSDEIRDAWLRSQGFRVLRLWNNEVMGNLEGVLQRIFDVLHPSSQPSPTRGEGL